LGKRPFRNPNPTVLNTSLDGPKGKTMSTQQLVTRLEKARDAYYNGSPIMTDAEYDTLESSLRQQEPSHPFLKQVGAMAPSSGWQKVRHEIPMGSLAKAQVKAEMEAWWGKSGKAPITVTEKLDGMSISLRYEDRKLTQAVTRGDGVQGEDITVNVLKMKGAVKILPPSSPDILFVRGEIIITHTDFAANFPGESNPRNSASGTSKRQTDLLEKCRHLTVMAYQYLPDGAPLKTKKEEIQALIHCGFHVPFCEQYDTLQEAHDLYDQYVATKRKSLNYDIDGLVVELDDTEAREDLGVVDGRPKGAIALKFPHEEKPTILRSIRWQVGNTGRVTPVAEFDPVSLAGANVKQASLHNISRIEEMVREILPTETLFREGDEILVCRRNDVIPHVEALLNVGYPTKPFQVPTECPACGNTLERDGEYLICPNDEECPAQITGGIKKWVKELEILHFGETMIQALIEFGLIEDAADLYTVDANEAAFLVIAGGRRLGETAAKALTNLHRKKILPLHIFVAGLGIKGIGKTTSQTLIDAGIDTLSKMYKVRISEISGIPGIGDITARNFVLGFEKRAPLIAKLLGNGIQIQMSTGHLKGYSFCLTGFRDPKMSETIEKLGGSVKSGASKTLDYLICQDPTSTSGKAKKARDYNAKGVAKIQLISKEEAWELIKGDGK